MSVRTSERDAVAIVTLDRPEQRNSLGPAEAGELADALSYLGRREDLAAVVLTGNGPFCAGGDLVALLELSADGPGAVRDAIYANFHRLIRELLATPVPMLAAVDGPAVGVGMDLALACDWRLIGPGGSFRHAWGELSLIPGTGGELLLRRVAPGLLWQLLGRPRWIGPEEAGRLGLAEPAAEEALAAALRLAEGLSEVSSPALRGYVRLHRRQLLAELDEQLELCLELQVELLCSSEFRARAERSLQRLASH